jgi:acyl carrier protein
MDNKAERRNLYRVLRKTGIPKSNISIDASFTEDLHFDTTDWSIFTFYFEDIFNVSIGDEEFRRLNCVNDTLALLKNTA